MLQDKQYKVQANQRGTTPAEQFSNSHVIVKSSRVASLKLEWQPFFPNKSYHTATSLVLILSKWET